MYGKLYQKIKEGFYSFIFILIILYRWIVIDPTDTFDIYLSTIIYFIPLIMLCILFYYSYRYYMNDFINSRLGSSKGNMISHLKYVLREALCFGLWQLILIFFLGFGEINIETLVSFFITIVTVLTSYIIITLIYYLVFLYFRKYNISFVLNCTLILVYKFFVTWGLEYGSYRLTYEKIEQNFVLIVVNVILLFIQFLMIYFKISNKKLGIKKNIVFLFCYLGVEIFSLFQLIGFQEAWYSFSLEGMPYLDTSNYFFAYIFWIVPKLLIMIFGFYHFVNSYRHNLLFYMTRINNRKKWVLKKIKDILFLVSICSLLKVLLLLLYIKIFRFK